MMFRGLHLTLAWGLLSMATIAPAAETGLQVVENLRRKARFEEALKSLEKIEHEAATPAETLTVIPFEKAITLIEWSLVQDPNAASEQLDQAGEILEKFVEDHPQHPLAGRAQTWRGSIFLGKARADIRKADSVKDGRQQAAARTRALAHVKTARNLFESAHEKYSARFHRYPPFIDRVKDAERYEQRAAAEVAWIYSRLDLAMTIYEEAQCHAPESPEYTKAFTRARDAFEEINRHYRSMGAGLFARLWQGKCWQELGETGRAVGIYRELLAHVANSTTIQTLQDQAQRFRTISRNGESLQDARRDVQKAAEYRDELRLRIEYRRPQSRLQRPGDRPTSQPAEP